MTSTEYSLPALPLSGGGITILRWLKRPGETLAAGEPLLIVLTDRAEIALPAPIACVLVRLADEGSSHPAGAVVATFIPEATPATSAPPPIATPLARRVAAAHNIALQTLSGSGPGGRITRADVLAAAPALPPPVAASAPATLAAAPVAPLAAHDDTYVLTAMEADLSAAAELCARLSPAFARRGLAVELATCVAQAVATALQHYPLLNARWDDQRIIVPRGVQLAYTLGGRSGLVANAQDRNLQGFARAMATPAPTDTQPTFSLLASQGAAWCTPRLGSTQTAAVALGAAQPRPVVQEGHQQLTVRLTALLTLAYDARVAEHAYADAFLKHVIAQLARPSALA